MSPSTQGSALKLPKCVSLGSNQCGQFKHFILLSGKEEVVPEKLGMYFVMIPLITTWQTPQRSGIRALSGNEDVERSGRSFCPLLLC